MRPDVLQPFQSRSSDRTSTRTGCRRSTRQAITGPFNATGAGRHAEPPPHLLVPAAERAARSRCAQHDPLDAGAPRRTAGRSRDGRRASRCWRSTTTGRSDGSFDARHSSWRCGGMLADPEFLFRVERDPATWRPARVLPRQRPRAGVAAVVLPLEQHPGRRAAAMLAERGPAAATRQCSNSRCGGCWPIRKRRRARRQFRRPVAAAAQPAERRCPTGSSFPTSTTTCGRRSGGRPSCSSRASCARTAASRPADGRLHVRQRAAGAALRHSRRVRQPLPPRDARRRGAARGLLGKGSMLAVTSHPNRTSPVVRGKWILENLLGTPPPPPPPDVPPLQENRPGEKPRTMRERMEEHRAQPGVRQLSPADGPARLRARELRRRRRVARRATPARQSTRRASCRTAPRWTASSTLRQALLGRPELFVRTMTEKLLTYALGRGLTHADMPVVRRDRP